MSSSNDKFERDFAGFLAGDDARLSALYRKLPQAEPDAKLDAAVLAMAHRALNPQLVATPKATQGSAARRRARWLPALGAAATAVFAIGVAVKMAPRMWTEQHEATPATARDEAVVRVRQIDTPAPAPEPPMSPPPPAQTATAGAAPPATRAAAPKPAAAALPPSASELQKSAPPPAPIAAEAAPAEVLAAKKVENVASPAPQAFPTPPARAASEMDAVERKQAIAEGAWHRLHDADAAAPAGAAGPAASAAAPAPAARAKAPAAAFSAEGPATQAAQKQDLDTIVVTGSNVRRVDIETASPATTIDRKALQQADKPAHQEAGRRPYSAQTLRNAKLYPESWLAAIQRLIRAGKRDEARENLDLFREKYPDHHLPADLERFARDAQ